jgi:hypothetical protein
VPGYPAVPELDRVIGLSQPTVDDYVAAASAYVINGRKLPIKGDAHSDSAKSAQGALSRVLGQVIANELAERHRQYILNELGPDAFKRRPRQKTPHVLDPVAAETSVAGGLRTAQSDVTEAHRLDGVRLAVELKPSYRAVGRAIWNRYGDVRAFAVNIHLKFPFAVVGGVQVLPTIDVDEAGHLIDTRSSLNRAARRLSRIRPRETEADAGHLLEAFGLIIIDPVSGGLHPDIPPPGSSLRWDPFLDALVEAYDVRFGAEAG